MTIRIEVYDDDEDQVFSEEYEHRKDIPNDLAKLIRKELPPDDGDMEGMTPAEKQAYLMKQLEDL
jgi:hypothetical protein